MWNIKIPLIEINLVTPVMALQNPMIVFYTETIDGKVLNTQSLDFIKCNKYVSIECWNVP